MLFRRILIVYEVRSARIGKSTEEGAFETGASSRVSIEKIA